MKFHGRLQRAAPSPGAGHRVLVRRMRLFTVVSLMRRIIITALLWGAALSSGAEPELAGDYIQLQGRWIVFRCERDGATMPERNGSVFIYQGKTVRLGTDSGAENYVVREETNPKSIDFLDARDPPVLGIYKFEGEALIICSADPGRERPKTFETQAGDGRILTHMRRAK